MPTPERPKDPYTVAAAQGWWEKWIGSAWRYIKYLEGELESRAQITQMDEICEVCGHEMWVRENIKWCTHCHPGQIAHRGPDPNARYVYPDGTYYDTHAGERKKFVPTEAPQ